MSFPSAIGRHTVKASDIAEHTGKITVIHNGSHQIAGVIVAARIGGGVVEVFLDSDPCFAWRLQPGTDLPVWED